MSKEHANGCGKTLSPSTEMINIQAAHLPLTANSPWAIGGPLNPWPPGTLESNLCPGEPGYVAPSVTPIGSE